MGNMQSLGLGSGHALPAPQTASATNGQMFAADGTWKYPPGYLLAANTGANFTSAGAGTTETSVLPGNAAITNLFLAGVAVGDEVQIRAAGTWLNNAASQTLRLRLYMAATVIADFTSAAVGTSATARNWQLFVDVVYTSIAGGGAGEVRAMGWILDPATTGTGYQGANSGTAALAFNEAPAVAITTNAAANCNLTGTLSSATSGATVTCNLFKARYFPKGY